ncbi:carboxypeptidase B-like [Trichoplusia ni]|uniref:Carboxypeptidase B-like n=1 Tax=Trichoplusia ni TaxID=7111 RepID=A0A7E5W745_TRINI|nr:carboxypeptidase B-like [Trichoplusia ni]
MRSLLVFCLCLYGVWAKHEVYDGSAVYEVSVNDVNEIKFINQLENELFVDVWSHAMPGRPGQVLVPKDKRDQFESALKDFGLTYKVVQEDVRKQLELEDRLLAAAAARSSKNSSRLSFDTIHTYDEVDAYLEELGKTYPDVVTVVVAGNSIEGRPIKYLRISTTDFQDTSKPIVMMQSLLHAREWITLPATLYAIQKLVIDVTESDLLQEIDWIILPVANPDGYSWTHTNSRFWRKNRATGFMVGDFCAGVDLNRNFDIHWSTASSGSVCSDTFHGRGPFSEPETKAIHDVLAIYGSRVALYLDIHSFGSMILFGYGNGVLPSNALTINLVGVNMAQAIDRVKWPQNRNYIVGNIAHVLYDASGGASDYAMVAGAPLSYTFELPAFNNNHNTLNGFLVDPAFIEQAGFETWEGIKVGARAAASYFRNRNYV